MKFAKKIRTILITVLILIVVLVIAFHLFGTKAIKVGIEAGATRALKVPVAVGDVNLSVLAGKAGVRNLIIDNPPATRTRNYLSWVMPRSIWMLVRFCRIR